MTTESEMMAKICPPLTQGRGEYHQCIGSTCAAFEFTSGPWLATATGKYWYSVSSLEPARLGHITADVKSATLPPHPEAEFLVTGTRENPKDSEAEPIEIGIWVRPNHERTCICLAFAGSWEINA